MSNSVIVIGIDGGGSKTRAAVVNQDGLIIGVGAAGSSNYDDVGVDAAGRNVSAAVRSAWNSSGIDPIPIDAAFLGMAGVRAERDAAAIADMAKQLKLAPPERIGVDHDARTALTGALAGRPGIALIAGTGSSCYGRTADGRSWMSGGWGLLDDFGSSWYLGMHAMMAAVQAYDGRGEATQLMDDVRTALSLSDLTEILHRFHVDGMTRAEVAALAPIVVTCAEAGDKVAQAILRQGASELAHMAEAVAVKLEFPDDVSIATIGGLVNGSAHYGDLVKSALQRRLVGCRVARPALPPVIGAALLAFGLADVRIIEAQIEELKRSASRWNMP